MEFAVLGPLQVRDACGEVVVAGRKERALLALLLARRGQVVGADTLVEELWPSGPPPTAARTLQAHVARLRTSLGGRGEGGAPVRRTGPGWVLDLTDERVDSDVFSARAATAARALRESRFTECAHVAREALSLWRGQPYDGHTDLAPCASEAVRLEATRSALEEDSLEAGLALGLATELVPRLEAAVAADPLRERMWALLMVALYRCGRQSAALDAYARARRTLAEEIGVDPGPELVRVHRQVLQQALPMHAPMPVVLGTSSATRCPFPGLACYDEGDAEAFVGRERVVARLLERVADGTPVCLVGASGSGKSSVLRAGLLPVLRAGALPGSDRWRTAVVTPGSRPDTVLGGTEGLDLLVLDQAEELLTLADADTRSRAVAVLLARVDAGTRLVLGVRSDFWAPLAEVPRLGVLVADGSVPLGPLGEDELRRVVVEGARRGGAQADDDLVERILQDVHDQPGALPLLSTALAMTWQRRDGDRLTVAGYEAAGGLHGAVAQLAEETYAGLSPGQQRAAQRLLVRLVADTGDGRPTRRRVAAPALVDREADAQRALEALVAARLVVAGAGVEVAHEALFTAWPRYAEWIRDDADGRRLRERLTPAARAWDAGGRREGDLVRGPLLAAAGEWAAAHPHGLDALERDLVAASVAAVERDHSEALARAEREARRSRALRWLLTATAVLLAVAVVAGVLAVGRSRQAAAEATTALAARVGAQALVEPRLDRALLLARQAVAIQDRPETRGDLLVALTRTPDLVRVSDVGHRLFGLAVSPQGRIIVTTNQGDLRELDPITLAPRVLVTGSGNAATGVEFAADGRVLVAMEQLPGEGGAQLRLRDGTDGRLVAALAVPDAWYVHASPAGDRLVTAASGVSTSWSRQGDRWTRRLLPADVDAVSDFGAGGRAFATVSLSSGATLRRAADAGVLLSLPAARGSNVALSPDGSLIVVADTGGSLEIWSTRTGRHVADLAAHAAAVDALSFSADGRRLLSSSEDGSAIVWDVATGTPLRRLQASRGYLTAAFMPDPGLVVTAAGDGTVALWDIGGRRSFGVEGRVPPGEPGSSVVALTPDARTLAVAGAGHVVHVLDAPTVRERRRVRADEAVTALAVAPDGGRLVVGTAKGADLVDLTTGHEVPLPPEAGAGSGGVAFSPDGRQVAIADALTGSVALVDTAGGTVLRRWRAGVSAGGVTFTPDSRLLVAGGADADGSAAIVWRVADGEQLHRLAATEDRNTPPVVAATRGTEVAVAGRDGAVRFWDAGTGAALSDPLPTLPGLPLSLSASGDGAVVAAAGWDGSLALLDGHARVRLGPTLPSYDANQAAAVVSRDGRTLVAVWADGATRRWDLDPAGWQRRVCQITGRSLTAAEWRLYVGDQPYEPAC